MASVNKSKLTESAQKFLAKGQVDKALKDYEKILGADPGDSNTRLKAGDLRQRLGQKDQAVADYRRVAEKFKTEGFYSKAVAVLKRVLSVDPNLVEIHLDLAELNQKLGLLSEVVHHYQIAANLHDRRGEKRQAIDILQKAAEVGTPNPDRKAKVAELYYKEGFPDAGFDQVVHLLADFDPKSPELIPLLERFCKACPDDPRLKIKLGEVHLTHGDDKSALEIAEQAAAEHRDGRAVELLAEIRMDDPEEEKSLLSEAIDLYKSEGCSAKVRELSDRLEQIKSASAVSTAKPPRAPEKAAAPVPEAAATPELEPEVAPEAAPAPEVPPLRSPSLDDQEASEQERLESSLSEADVCLKYGRRDRAITLLEKIATHYPHRHEAPLRLRSIYESAGDFEAVAVQCRRLARVADGRNDPERAARFLAEAEEAEARVEGAGPLPTGSEPVAPAAEKPLPIPEEPPSVGPTPEAPSVELGGIELVIEDAGGTSETIETAPSPAAASQTPPPPTTTAQPSPQMDDLEIHLDDEVPASSSSPPFLPDTRVAAADSEEELILEDAFDEEPAQAASGPAEAVAAAPHAGTARSVEEEMILEETAAEMGMSPETFTPDVPQAPPPAPPEPALPAAALEVPESEPPADLEEADFYASQGMFDEAIEIYRRALRGRPDDEALLARLDELLRASAGRSPAGQAVTTPITEVQRGGEVTPGFGRVAASEEPPSTESEGIISLEDEEAILDQPPSEEAPLDLRGLDLPMEPRATEAAPPEEEPTLEKPEWIEERRPAVAEGPAAGAPSVEENDFDLRAELEDELPEPVGEDGGVSAATEALSKLVEELQSLEEEEVTGGPEAQTHYDLGIAYKEMGLLDDATRELRIASRDPQRWLECRTVLGICYREQERADEAIKEFEECLGDPRITGHDPTALFYEMALTHEEAGRPEDALRCHERAAEIDPEFRDVQKRIAALGGKKGAGRKGASRAHLPEEGGKAEPGRRDSKKKISYL